MYFIYFNKYPLYISFIYSFFRNSPGTIHVSDSKLEKNKYQQLSRENSTNDVCPTKAQLLTGKLNILCNDFVRSRLI